MYAAVHPHRRDDRLILWARIQTCNPLAHIAEKRPGTKNPRPFVLGRL